mgnify:CR=1 FL=1
MGNQPAGASPGSRRHNKKNTRIFAKQGAASKENRPAEPLPVFKEPSRGDDQKTIPQLTVADTDSEVYAGQCGAILSDLSDENLIRQLRLNMHGPVANTLMSINLNSQSQAIENSLD